MSTGQGTLQLWALFFVIEWKFNPEEVRRERGHLLWQRQPVSEGFIQVCPGLAQDRQSQ